MFFKGAKIFCSVSVLRFVREKKVSFRVLKMC